MLSATLTAHRHRHKNIVLSTDGDFPTTQASVVWNPK
jgi:hypothetical protein